MGQVCYKVILQPFSRLLSRKGGMPAKTLLFLLSWKGRSHGSVEGCRGAEQGGPSWGDEELGSPERAAEN